MEHRDQKHENHGVHICNKCGWQFPNPHPSAKHRRAHKKVCGKIEEFKPFESEPNTTHLTLSDDDDNRNFSPKVLEKSCDDDKVIDGIGKKSKESEDEVFSDAVAEFSESVLGVGTNKPVGDASDLVTILGMIAKDELNGSSTSNDREIADLLSSSRSSTENRKVDNSNVAENTIDQSGSGSEIESKSNQEFVNLETHFKTGESVIIPGYHMSATAGDLYPVEPETVIAASQQESDNNSVDNVHQCCLTSSDRRYDEGKIESSSLDRNLEITVSSGVDNDEYELVPKIEEAVKMPTEPTTPDGTLLLKAENDISIHSKMPPSDVVSDVKSFDLSKITSNAGKEIQSADSLLETDKIEEGIENVHLHPKLGDFYVVDHPEAFVKDLKDHEVSSTNFSMQDPTKGVNGSEDNVKDPIPEDSYSTFQEKPNQALEVASINVQAVENRQKQESEGKEVPFDGEVDWSKNSGQEVKETPVQGVDATDGILNENEKQLNNQTLGDAARFTIDSIHSVCFSPEVESISPSKNSSLDKHTKSVTEVLCDENSTATPIGNQMNINVNEVGTAGGCLTEDDNKARACGRNLEDSVHVATDILEKDDNSIREEDEVDNPDIAGVEHKNGPLEEIVPIETNSIPESTTNSAQNRCHTVTERLSDGSSTKLSGTGNADLGTFDISLGGVDTKQTVKEDDCDSAVHVACISEVNADDQSYRVRDFNSVQNISEDRVNEETNLVSVSNESVTATSQDGTVRQFVGEAVRNGSETSHEGEKGNIKPELLPSLIDVSVDSLSQTDSLEGNWGSVSVLSTQSDLPAVVNAEAIPHAEETNLKKAEAANESQHSDKSDLFEPPSFMTLVEPTGGVIRDSAALEIEPARNLQHPNPASLQAGWFPSYTHVANDSPGRKKNEAIIAKVTNWSTGKPHTALKNLLDDAALENRQKPPNLKENLASVIQKDENLANNSSVVTTVDSVMRPTSPRTREIAKEWNSPARYPSDIKREKRKGRPYWAQFVCCSSVH